MPGSLPDQAVRAVDAVPGPAVGRRATLLGDSTTRLWLSSLAWALALILAAVAAQAVETDLFGLRGRASFVRDPAELAMRVVGIGHHLVAAFFLVTSARLRAPAGVGWLAGLALLGVGLSWVFGWLGGHAHPLGLAAFYLLFVAHSFHDEVRFYDHHAGAGLTRSRLARRAVAWAEVAAVAVLGAVLVPVFTFLALNRTATWMPAWVTAIHPIRPQRARAFVEIFPGDWSFAAVYAVVGLPLAVVVLVAAGRLLAARPLLRPHAPVVCVLAGGAALGVASAVLGAWTLRLVILMHFVSWFLFTTARLGEATVPVAGPGVVAWLRGTRRGFWVLHGGICLGALGLLVLDHSVLGPRWSLGGVTLASPVAALLGRDAFYYWTILHVTLSLVPRAPGTPRLRGDALGVPA